MCVHVAGSSLYLYTKKGPVFLDNILKRDGENYCGLIDKSASKYRVFAVPINITWQVIYVVNFLCVTHDIR